MYDQGSAPSISHLHWNAGVARANLAVVAIGSDNKVRVRNSTGTADFIVDVLGYTNAQKPNSSYGRTIPAVGGAARMYDSRLTTPLSASSPARCVNVYDFTDETGAGLPIDGLSGLWLNVTAVSPTGPGFLRVYGGASFSSHSNINFRAGDLAVANLALVKVPSFGSVCVEYGGSDSVDFIFDSVAFTREST